MLTWIYYLASCWLWLGLTVLVIFALRPGFPEWLRKHPAAMVKLLGTDRMPDQPGRTLRRFYLFLYSGFTWLLAWSWWVMPAVKKYLYQAVTSEQTYQIARYSTLGVYALYAAVGFFAIARGIMLWFKKIYGPAAEDKGA